MLERGKIDRGVIEIVDTESLVPKGHLLRKIAGKGRDSRGLKALREGTDGGSQRRLGSPREEAF